MPRYLVARMAALALVLAAGPTVLAGCGAAPATPATPGTPGSTVTVGLGDRPFRLHVPKQYRSGGRLPLVVVLHGYTSSAEEADRYFGLTAESDRRGFLYAMPDGTRDPDGHRFWNAT